MAQSPDLTPLDFVLWSYVKGELYKNQCAFVVELTEQVTDIISLLSCYTMKHTTKSVISRSHLCLQQIRFHFEHIMFIWEAI